MADENHDRAGGGSSGGTMTNVDPVGRPGGGTGQDPAFAIGQVVAERYRVERFIARGGMGEVYEVQDSELGERVALKTILPRTAHDKTVLERFRREIQVARKVSHRNVCRIFDIGRHQVPDGEDVLFLTMELLHGESLRQRLLQGVMTPDEALTVVEQVAAGLGAAHRRGIVHRDLKPSNIFLVPEGDEIRTVIADFGLARSQVEDGAQYTVTGTGEILGTPAYMAPEQIEGKRATTATDIYALGLIMYEMLTGAKAFEGESAFQIAINRLREAPTSPSKHTPGVPPRWDRTILRCLEKEPEDRLADVEDIPHVLAGSRRMPRRSLRTIAKQPITWFVLGAVVLMAGYLGYTKTGGRPGWIVTDTDSQMVEVRRSVAVLGFQNLTGDPDTAWISTALADFLTTELAAGGALRAVPSQSVSQARSELGLEEVTTLAPESLDRLRERLATDLVILGSFTVLGDEDEEVFRLDCRVQDVANPDPIVIEQMSGPLDDIFEIATSAAAEIRGRLGLDAADEAAARGVLPSDPEAARLYAEGVVLLRSHDPQGAREKLEAAAEAAPDSPLVWLELANAWTGLGYANNAIEAAQRAGELSEGLDQELRLRIEGQSQYLVGSMREAVDTFRSLWLVHPDNLEYGIWLGRTQVAANMVDAAFETVSQLRALPRPLGNDPRIDLIEASAAGNIGDYSRKAEAARRVVEEGDRLGSASLEAEARLALGDALRIGGEFDQALVELEAARLLQEESGNRAGVSAARHVLALTYLDQGNRNAAIEEVRLSLAAAREVGSRNLEADGLNLLGGIRYYQGEVDAALANFEAALELQREVESHTGEADALNNIALVRMWSGDLAGAVETFSQVRAKRRSLDDHQGEALAVMNLAQVYAIRGDLDGARRFFEEAAGMFQEQQNQRDLAEARYGLGEVLLTQGDLAGARIQHDQALAIRRETGSDKVVASEFALAGLVLAEAALGSRSYHEVIDGLSTTVSQFVEIERPDLEADALNYLAEAQIGAGLVDEAEASLERITEIRDSANSVTILVMEINRARVKGKRGEIDAALRVIDGVIARAGEQSTLAVELEARLAKGEILADAGRLNVAERELSSLRQDASARGWVLVAKKVDAVMLRLEESSD